jgi:hypothetical protein
MQHVRAHRSGIAALTAMAFLCLVPVPASSQTKTYALDAYPFPHAIPLQQWRSVLARASPMAERWREVPCRDGAPALACASDRADRLERHLKDLPPKAQVAGVYAFYNAFRYRHRRGDCGTDCWATPLEFIAQRSGDCHDYVVAEYLTLRRLGFDNRSLQLMIVQLKGNDDPFAGGHMVLRVRLSDRDYVLDNRKRSLGGPSALKEYKVLAGLDARNIELYDGPLVRGAKVKPPAQRAIQASPGDTARSGSGDAGRCLQTSTLDDWNPALPCTVDGNASAVRIEVND